MNSTPQSNSSSQNTECSVGKTRAYSSSSAIAVAELSRLKSIDITDSCNDFYFSCDSQIIYTEKHGSNKSLQRHFYSSVHLPSVNRVSLLEHITRGKIRAKQREGIKFCNKAFDAPKVLKPIAPIADTVVKKLFVSLPKPSPQKEYFRNQSSSDILLDNFSKQSVARFRTYEKNKSYVRLRCLDGIKDEKPRYSSKIKIIKEAELKA